MVLSDNASFAPYTKSWVFHKQENGALASLTMGVRLVKSSFAGTLRQNLQGSAR
jgi:hypothetical protein